MHICLQLASLRTNFPLITVIKSTSIHDVHAREFPLFAFQTPNAHSKPDAIDAMFSPIPHSHKSSNTALHVKAPFNPRSAERLASHFHSHRCLVCITVQNHMLTRIYRIFMQICGDTVGTAHNRTNPKFSNQT